MRKKELSRKLHTYANLKTRIYKVYTAQENRAEEMVERMRFITEKDLEDLDNAIKKLGEAQAEKRFTQNILASKLEDKLNELITKYANQKEKEVEND